MSFFNKSNKDQKDVFLESVKAQREELLEKIRVKCPYCKEQIPSTALRCSHCAGDLAVKEIRAKMDAQVAAYQKNQRIIAIVGLSIVLVFIVIIGVAVSGDSQSPSSSASQVQPQQTPQVQASHFSYLCSRQEKAGHTASYYLVNGYGGGTFSLNQKLTDVTVRVSTIRNEPENWDTAVLCKADSLDLPASEWEVLAAGSDCGLGASKSPCDADFIADARGVTGIIIAPQLNGYTSKTAIDYAKKGALIKVTGIPVKP